MTRYKEYPELTLGSIVVGVLLVLYGLWSCAGGEPVKSKKPKKELKKE